MKKNPRADSLDPATHLPDNAYGQRISPRLSSASKTFDVQITPEKLSQLLVWYLYWDIVDVADQGCKWYQQLPLDTIHSWIRLGHELRQHCSVVPRNHAVALPSGLQRACDTLGINEGDVCQRLMRLSNRDAMVKSEIADIQLLGDDFENRLRLRRKFTADRIIASVLRPISNTSFEQKREQIVKRIDDYMTLEVLPKLHPERYVVPPAKNVAEAKERDQVRAVLGKQGTFRLAHPPQDVYEFALRGLRWEEPISKSPPVPPSMPDSFSWTTTSRANEPRVSSLGLCDNTQNKTLSAGLDENNPVMKAMLNQLTTLTQEVKQLSSHVTTSDRNPVQEVAKQKKLMLRPRSSDGFRTHEDPLLIPTSSDVQDHIPRLTVQHDEHLPPSISSSPSMRGPSDVQVTESRQVFRVPLQRKDISAGLSNQLQHISLSQECPLRSDSHSNEDTSRLAVSSQMTASNVAMFPPTASANPFASTRSSKTTESQLWPQAEGSCATKETPLSINTLPYIGKNSGPYSSTQGPHSLSTESKSVSSVYRPTERGSTPSRRGQPLAIYPRGSSLRGIDRDQKSENSLAEQAPSPMEINLRQQKVTLSTSHTASNVLAVANWHAEARAGYYHGSDRVDTAISLCSENSAPKFRQKHSKRCLSPISVPTSSKSTSTTENLTHKDAVSIAANSTNKAKSCDSRNEGPSSTQALLIEMDQGKCDVLDPKGWAASYAGSPVRDKIPLSPQEMEQRFGHLSPGYIIPQPATDEQELMPTHPCYDPNSYPPFHPTNPPQSPVGTDRSHMYSSLFNESSRNVSFSPTYTEHPSMSRLHSMRSAHTSVYEPSVYFTPPTSPVMSRQTLPRLPPGAWRDYDSVTGEEKGRGESRVERRERISRRKETSTGKKETISKRRKVEEKLCKKDRSDER
jgi:hypothetical protein